MFVLSSRHSLPRKCLLIFLMALAVGATAKGQTTDYVYGIQYGQGTGLAGDTWNLQELKVTVNGSGTATSYTDTTLTNLTTIIPGWDSAGTTRQNQCLNGLALDPLTKTLFLTYSYNNNSSATAGTFNVATYALRYNGSGFTATNIFNFSEAAGSAGTAGVIGLGGDPGSANVGAGWFTKGTYYNGAYYVGVQASTNNLVSLTLGPGENSVTTATVFTNINNGGASANSGGDMVISGGNLYISGRVGSGSTFATTTLANALNPVGSAWNNITSGSAGTYYYQLAGLGQITNLYGFASGAATPTFGQFTNYNNPSGSAPIFTTISGTSPVIVADLSDGAIQSILVPEPAATGAGIICAMAAMAEYVRRRRVAAGRRAEWLPVKPEINAGAPDRPSFSLLRPHRHLTHGRSKPTVPGPI